MDDSSQMQPHVIDIAESTVVRLIQITDCHIFEQADERLWGLNTRQSFEAVCARVTEENEPPDAVLATGDLSQDGSADSYRYLGARFDDLNLPTFWLPGNHDDSDSMASHFKAGLVLPAKRLFIGAWQVVLLDSTIKGEVHGRVAPAQLEFLDAALEDRPDRNALVCLHHQALESGSRWIDSKGLRDGDQLRAALARHANVRGVLWGHVHQEMHRTLDGVDWMSTPSTCVQFKPGAKTFGLGTEAPGYRRLTLHANGRIETSVQRIEHRSAS